MRTYRQRGTVLTEHTFSVPLDHDRPGGDRIEVFAREVVAADRGAPRPGAGQAEREGGTSGARAQAGGGRRTGAGAGPGRARSAGAGQAERGGGTGRARGRAPDGGGARGWDKQSAGAGGTLPWLLFLQGGPGFGGPRLSGRSSWLDRALNDFRVLLLDQRGTGRSTPATRQTLAGLDSARDQAAYLSHFRADSIVADAELIRGQLTGGEPWSILGQSFGGFCTVTYLSRAPEGIREAFITGGLPGLQATADDVYRATYPRMRARSLAHYARYPGDVAQAREVARHLAGGEVTLPDGARLTVEAFQSLGAVLGQSAGSDELHYLLEGAFAGGQLADSFLHDVHGRLSFARGPLYAVLQEACYAQGTATRWAAQRIRGEFAEFSPAVALAGDQPLLFTGEMIYPWMFELDPVLRPLRAAAEVLASSEDWPPLYDPARLAANEVPVAAAVYFDDMYVPRELSLPTAAEIGGLRAWVTSEYEHDGLRVSDGAVLDRLIAMARGLA